ncbi:hypothetical protein OHA18_42870 [Kribbella sp. NBC_00709]|uniref:hypothetical protein n=1 Tax=Kribbella sp. NBC_00709 TaxID=2975972 RepID=UPI002E2A4767|nr:hypothetical protein [Kribbella sp. NBC_00709]
MSNCDISVLASTQPQVALVLAHAMSRIVAACFSGIHTFPPAASLDAVDTWQRWIFN